MGPPSATRFPGHALVDVAKRPAARARPAIDSGRRGAGSVFGAFPPLTGEALTWSAARRTTANFVAFLEQVDAGIDPGVQRVSAIRDRLFAHRATDVVLFALAHPRWQCVFQPKYAADLTRIEPWGTILRSLALKGRRFETCEAICTAVAAATASWTAHQHPFIWGRQRRHRPRRQPGIALLPSVA
jgi:hypothetical protein